MLRKWIYVLMPLLVAGCLVAASCDKDGGSSAENRQEEPDIPPAPDDPDNPSPVSNTTLLELCQRKITQYNYSETSRTNHVFICCHRANTYAGQQAKLPENSIPAIQKAIEVGADMIEIDVRQTKDNKLVLMHDASVGTTTDGGSKNVNTLTLEEVKALKMKKRSTSTYTQVNGEYIRVPTLEEALTACKGKIYVNLDIKEVSSPNYVLKVIRETGTADQVMVYGSGEPSTYAGNNGYNLKVAVHPFISNPSEIPGKSYGGQAKLFQYDTDVYYGPSISSFGSKCHAQGALSYSNSLNYDSQITTWNSNGRTGTCTVLERFVESGSDFIQTDMCELADAYFKTKGLR